MAIPHANPGDIVDVRPLGAGLADARSVALFKSDDLELMRLVLPAGRSLPPHQVAGDFVIQCLEGAIEVDAQGQRHTLQAGQLLYLPGGAPHGVTALQDASALVTVALRKP
jgi:quercetin dioxygenase-like cupin family protein